MTDSISAIRENLFPAAHAAIVDWQRFPWHRDKSGKIQAHKANSSQALAIDVFGTIKMSLERDTVLGAVANACGLPPDGPWSVELEWTDEERLLGELRPTQVDVLAFGGRSLLVIECKFTESGGTCTQPKPLSGPNVGLRQCNGDYRPQVNPLNGIHARCALSGKGVKYWDLIPRVYDLDPESEYRPCPFKGENYQWMRNVVLAERLGMERAQLATVIAAFADAECFVTARKARRGLLGYRPAHGRQLIFPISFQAIIKLAKSVSDRPWDWESLNFWVERKIEEATKAMAH